MGCAMSSSCDCQSGLKKLLLAAVGGVTNPHTITNAFVHAARLDQDGLFAAVEAAGRIDLSRSEYGALIYAGNQNAGSIDHLRTLLHRVDAARYLYRKLARHKAITLTEFPSVVNTLLGRLVSDRLSQSVFVPEFLRGSAVLVDFVKEYATLLLEPETKTEAFMQHDADGDGQLNEVEFVTMLLSIAAIADAFSIAVEKKDGSVSVGPDTYGRALQLLGFGGVAVLQGQLIEAIFARMDITHDGRISLPEFVRSALRLSNNVRWNAGLEKMPMAAGWDKVFGANIAYEKRVGALAECVNTLQTGDVLLTRINDTLGKYLQFATDSPWNHASVVIRCALPLPAGTANEVTEEILQHFPFRRASHKFCSPGYCRCFDASGGHFHSSNIQGTSEVALLESTGEGIHVYDLVHRMFESPFASEFSELAVRRLVRCDGGVRDGVSEKEAQLTTEFLTKVRGMIYSTAATSLKKSVEYHLEKEPCSGTCALAAFADVSAAPLDKRSQFCSQVVTELLQHLEWVGLERPAASVMPCDFDPLHDKQKSGRPVELRGDKGLRWHPELEKMWSSKWPAHLPLKKPKKGKVP